VTAELAQLAERIRGDLHDIDRLVKRVAAGWNQAQRTNDDLYIDSVALNLHSFYSKIESLFERVASTVDGEIPEGENWHYQLLEQMSVEVPSLRPAVISDRAKELLHELRGFRHVARNIYPFNISKEKLAHLVAGIPQTYELLAQELSAFAEFVERPQDEEPEK
jgi:hypothetical protein